MSGFEWNADALLSSGVGALVGSALTLAGAWLAHHLGKNEANRKDDEHILGLLQAIHDEVEALWESYIATAGAQIEALQDEHPVLMYWPLTQDYFTIYNTNALSIGKIKDHDLRKQIVATYTRARGLVDSFRMNNELLQKWEHTHLLFQESQSELHKMRAQAHYESLTQYAASLKKTHLDLKSMAAELLRSLRERGGLSPNGAKS